MPQYQIKTTVFLYDFKTMLRVYSSLTTFVSLQGSPHTTWQILTPVHKAVELVLSRYRPVFQIFMQWRIFGFDSTWRKCRPVKRYVYTIVITIWGGKLQIEIKEAVRGVHAKLPPRQCLHFFKFYILQFKSKNNYLNFEVFTAVW
jgi:hypothetical protein